MAPQQVAMHMLLPSVRAGEAQGETDTT